MKFQSVRGKSPEVGFKEALFNGIAPDGGLYVPVGFPELKSKFLQRNDITLHEMGAELVASFIEEIPKPELLDLIRTAWDFPIPVVLLEDRTFLLELFHGPTLAFKDVGAKFMAGVMSWFLRREERKVTILVATSGDTGSAVANGFHNVPNISVFVLYPSGKVSPLQELQMTTLGGNIHAIEVEGTFDDCQKLVKQSFSDRELAQRVSLTTANSINMARLLPQAAYYAWGAYQMIRHHGVSHPPEVVVPSGNFGNLTAAVYAKALGTPFEHFIAATNANDVVPEFLQSGVYRARPSVATFSNAMDVGDPSNLARLISYYGDDVDRMRGDITATSISDEETVKEIRRTYEATGYISDPHTAVGIAAHRRLNQSAGPRRACIIASTAHPAKFPEVIKKAISINVPPPPALARAMGKPKQSTKMKPDLKGLKNLIFEKA